MMAQRVQNNRRKKITGRNRISAKYLLSKDADLDYKNVSLLAKYLNDRGKMLSRRTTGITAKEQRALSLAIKRARFFALLPVGGIKK